VGPDIPAVDVVGGMDVLRRDGDGGEDVLVVSVGAMAATCVEVADRLAAQGMGVTVVDPRWVKPVDPALTVLAARHRLVVTVEDNGRAGGVGSAVAQALRDAAVPTPVRDFGVPQRFLDHAKRSQLLEDVGLTAQGISRQVIEQVARLSEPLEDASVSELNPD
jgi:1-deoxy-D-xylulose-5-phosphate synthase